MNTLIFYVMLCTASDDNQLLCNTYEPYSWTYTTEEQRTLAFEECSTLVNAYDSLQATKETDCYVEE